jgi:hypothetical protein
LYLAGNMKNYIARRDFRTVVDENFRFLSTIRKTSPATRQPDKMPLSFIRSLALPEVFSAMHASDE